MSGLPLQLAFNANAPSSSTDAFLWALRGSVDGARVSSPTQRGPDGCESPGGYSSASSVRGPSCTGGGHGEAPPSNAGGSQQPLRNVSPLGRHSCSTTQLHSATATPLARTIAARVMRTPQSSTSNRPRTQDTGAAAAGLFSTAAAVSLPSITYGGSSRRELMPPHSPPHSAQHASHLSHGVGQGPGQGHGQGPAQAFAPAPAEPAEPSTASPPHPVTPPAPRPPVRPSRNSLADPSPRSRRATTQEPPAGADAAGAAAGSPFLGGGGAAAAAAGSASAISAPSTLASEPPPPRMAAEQPPRFSRLQSMPAGGRGGGRGSPQLGMGMGGGAADPRPAGQPALGISNSMPTHSQHSQQHHHNPNRASGLISPMQSPTSQSSTSQQDIPPLALALSGSAYRNTPSSGSIQYHAASVDGVAADAAASTPPGTSPHAQPPSPGRRVVINTTPIIVSPPPSQSPRLQTSASAGQARGQYHYPLNLSAATAEQHRRISEHEVAGSSSSSSMFRAPETPRPAHRPGEEPAGAKHPSTSTSPVPEAAAGPAFRARQPPPAPLRVSEGSLPSPGSGPANTPTSTPSAKFAAARSPSAGAATGSSAVGAVGAGAGAAGMTRLATFHPSPSPRAVPEADANAISSAGVLSPAADPNAPPPSHPASSEDRPSHPEPASPPPSPAPTASSSSSSSSSASPTPAPAVATPPLADVRLAVPASPALPPIGSFVALPTPEDGLLHLSASAPAGMRRPGAKWGVSDFRVMRKLYAGYASSVYRAVCVHSGTDVVLKAYNLAGLSTFLRHQVLRELSIHSRLDQTGVVTLLAAFKEGDLMILVLEYVRGGSLDRLRRRLGGRLSEFQARHLVLRPLLAVLAGLHAKGIMHRDIKPENLLFTEGWQLRVCDFGVSVCLSEERPVTRTGSREYMAPEVAVCPLKRGPGDGKDDPSLVYGPGVDVWSLGALTYELLVGFTPFPGGPPQQRKPGKEGGGSEGPAAELAFPAAISQPARTFVRACLQPDPADRPTVHQLLSHPWVLDSTPEHANRGSAAADA